MFVWFQFVKYHYVIYHFFSILNIQISVLNSYYNRNRIFYSFADAKSKALQLVIKYF